MMTIHPLSSGDGYTYLTRQVAAGDATDRGRDTLHDYYTDKGERAGQWIGSEAAELGVAGDVTEDQMRALFGEGRHPDADRIQAAMLAAGATRKEAERATRLGSKFPEFSAASPFLQACAVEFRDLNLAAGLRWNAPLPDAVRAEIRTRVGREMFEERHGRAPNSDQELHGFIAQESRPARTAVAGYDLTFTPPKSISALWAVAPRDVATMIEGAHREAVAEAMLWFEANVAHTRAGAGGVRKLDVSGVLAAEFVHRDSRAGDPNYHSHVPVSNKVRGPDGKWRALDGTVVFKATVAMSERYNTLIESKLRSLGIEFVDRVPSAGKRPVREIAGVDPELMAAWSSRSRAIVARQGELAAEFLTAHGRPPTPIEAIALAQQANLESRDPKHDPKSLVEQRAQWRAEAVDLLGEDRLAAMIRTATSGIGHAPAAGVTPTPVLVSRMSRDVIGVVSESRAKWQIWHVHAEADRQVRAAGIAPDQVDRVVAEVTASALAHGSVSLSRPDPVDPLAPDVLRRADGTSVYITPGAAQFTSRDVLAAEQRIVTAAGDRHGFRVSGTDVDLALMEWAANHGGRTLNDGQAALVREFATSGRRVQLGLAPAGTGKTTAMGVLARAVSNGGGHCVAFSPTATAAAELSAALGGAPGHTLALLTSELHKVPGNRAPWVRGIGPETLLIVDEAGMAGTRNLDVAIRYARHQGASVVLIGDDRQLAAVEAGAILRDIQNVHGAVSLNEVVRFRLPSGKVDGAQAAASLALRAGDPSALGYYLDHGRVHAGDSMTAVDGAFTEWIAARAEGLDAIILAPTRETVTELNLRARAARLAGVANGGNNISYTEMTPEVRLADGLLASVGDTIISKQNSYRLPVAGTDFVKNGDRWIITQVAPDGGLVVARVGDLPVSVALPPRYVAEHVRLGYATTIHGAQGVTTSVSIAVVDDRMTRNLLYVAGTRGTRANHFYVTVTGDGDPHGVIRPEVMSPQSAAEILAGILAREDPNTSAMTELAAVNDPAVLLGEAVARYADGIPTAAESLLGPAGLAAVDEASVKEVPACFAAPSWETLRGHLAVIALDGGDPGLALAKAVAERTLGDAHDPAAVLDWRLDRSGNHSLGEGVLPWIPAVPALVAADPVWGPYMLARSARCAELADQVRAATRTWTPETSPAWARPYLADHGLVAELAVWRASWQVNPADIRPVGDAPQRLALRTRAAALTARAAGVGGHVKDATSRWSAHLPAESTSITTDPYWPVLAARLNVADAAGLPAGSLLRSAIAERPLPVEHAAAAIWIRIAAHIAPTTGELPDGMRSARPPWTPLLQERLGPERAAAVLADDAWPSLVARLDQAVREGLDPAALVSDAAAMVAVHAADLPPADTASALLWQVSLLADPMPELDLDGMLEPDQELPADAWLVEDLPPEPARVFQEPDLDPGFEEVEVEDSYLDPAEPFQDEAAPPPVFDYSGMTPSERVAAAEGALATAVTEFEQLNAEVHRETAAAGYTYGDGPMLRAATVQLVELQRRADELRPLVAQAAWTHSDWLAADREAEIAKHDAADAAAALAADPRDPELDIEARRAVIIADGAESFAAEQRTQWQAADVALTAAAGGRVVTDDDVELLRQIANGMDLDNLNALRDRVDWFRGEVMRAELAAQRSNATGPVRAVPVGGSVGAVSRQRGRSVPSVGADTDLEK